MKNGGCDKNALCSHKKDTYEVVCTCKTGFTNVGGVDNVQCDGILKKQHSLILSHDSFGFLDSCTIKNGGCDDNAICSHDSLTYAIVCTCKAGYTNVGTNASVKCEGISS